MQEKNGLSLYGPPSRWIRQCAWCHSSPKYRAIVKVTEEHLGQSLRSFLSDPARRLYELSTTSGVHRTYRNYRNYVASGYFPDRPFGVELRSRVWNADAETLPFEDTAFDVVISSETFEHVRRPEVGFAEIHRVLRPNGVHCFTIPYRPDRPTIRRVDATGDRDVDLLPRMYHQDPYFPEGALVYTDFGNDLPELLQRIGFDTREHLVLDLGHDIHDDLRPMRVFLSQKTSA